MQALLRCKLLSAAFLGAFCGCLCKVLGHAPAKAKRAAAPFLDEASLPLLAQAVALDPRYGARKTRELVYGTAGGSLILSSKVGQSGVPHHKRATDKLPGLPRGHATLLAAVHRTMLRCAHKAALAAAAAGSMNWGGWEPSRQIEI
jgi:hypothetical protein